MKSSQINSQEPTKPKALNRWSVGSLSILQLACALLALISLNYLSSLHFLRADMSRDANYTLSSSTKRYLKSADIAKHQKPIKWLMVFRRSTPFYERVRATAEEYARLSNGKIQLEVIDPLRSPDRVQQITSSYGVNMIKDILIIDARKDDASPVREDAKTGIKSLHPNVKIAVLEDMLTYQNDSKSGRKPVTFQAEDVLTGRLVESIEGRPRKMAFISDKSSLDGDTPNSPWNQLANTLRFQNVELVPISIAELAQIPNDVEGVALIAPKYDFTEAEIKVLNDYWLRPSASLLLLLKPGENTARLRAFLRLNGVTPRRDRIVTNWNKRTVSEAKGFFVFGVDFLSDMKGQSVVFEGASSSLEVRESAPELQSMKIAPMALIETAETSWGETKFGDGKEKFDANEDTAGPLCVAAAITRGETKDEVKDDSSRMIVLGNVDFLQPERQRPENMDFLASSVNWLVKRSSLVGIGPRTLGTYKLPLLEAQVSFINRVNFIFLPAFLLLASLCVWSARRA